MKSSRILVGALLAVVLGSAATVQAASMLFVADASADSINIPAVLTGDGHTVTVVTNDHNGTTKVNTVLGGAGLGAYAGIFWNASGSNSSGNLHAASTMTNLSNYVSAGGYLFVTGYDSTASPNDANLRGLLGATGGNDLPAAPGAVINVANSLTVGVVDIRGVTPTGGFFDRDDLTGLGAGTVGVVPTGTSTTNFQWTLRTLGSGEAAYVSNSVSNNLEHGSWLDTSAGGAGAYNAALRNFAFAADAAVIPLPAGAWVGLALFGCMAVGAIRRKCRKA